MPLDEREWNVGLIVGPSGCGKSSILKQAFGGELTLTWGGACVVDDFAKSFDMQAISEACMAVGFNTIPAWLRPFSVLSNGEKFRVELARRLLEGGNPIVVDEFTSVVDRQVAQIGSHAVQKHVRKTGKKFIAASCHFDIVEWLQPDWIFEPATMQFQWRSLHRRPQVECVVRRVTFAAWQYFAPYHYLTRNLHRAANCFGLFINGRICSFAGMLKRPHPVAKDIWGVSRGVTLPDFQGLGLFFVLGDQMGAVYKAFGQRLRMYPSHPDFVRSLDRSKVWTMIKRPGLYSPATGLTGKGTFGGRPCAVFEYVGPAHANKAEALALVSGG